MRPSDLKNLGLLLAGLWGGSLAYGQLPGNLTAEGLGPSTASLSADPSASSGLVAGGGGGGGGARSRIVANGISSASVVNGSESRDRSSLGRTSMAQSALSTYGPTQTAVPHLSGPSGGIARIHISSGVSRNGLSVPTHSGGSSSSGVSAVTSSKPLYSTMLKIQRPEASISGKSSSKPGNNKKPASPLDRLLGGSGR
jgi:hypothetical protein